MEQQNSTPSNVSNKPKRGRPRKEQSGAQGKNVPEMAGSANVLNSNQSAHTTDNYDKVQPQMVGKMILGVIEGAFDGGYLIKVQVADTHLRGTVFLPGRFVPVTAENDVAPHVRTVERTDIPIPVLNSETQVHNPVASRKRKKKPSKPELQVPMPINCVPPTELHSDTFVVEPMANQETRVDSYVASSGQRNKQPLEPELLMPVPITQFHPFELHYGGATNDLGKIYEVMNLVATAEDNEKELGTGQQSVSPSVHKVNELIPDEPSCSNIENMEKEVWRLCALD